ncbi:MAG TPA: TCR/Tet family MFS transporter [Vicinamibacterales bacterium]|nr:TCR/Tet family MFS transporter [Vicinamibacterales bacterium]
MTQPSTAAAPRNAAVIFIFITVVLDVLALGIIVPVLPALVVEFLGGDTARAAETYGLFATTWAFMQFVASPVLGSFSDRFGRRPIILLSITGLGLDYIFMALAPSIRWLFVGRLISGVTSAGFATAAAYIADVTPADQRAKSFGLIGAAFGLGFVLGPALGGLLGTYSPRLPFWVSAALCLTNALYGVFVLPESLPPERRAHFSWARANPVGSLRLLRSHPELFGLASVTFLYYVAHEVLPSTFVLYTGYRYGWNSATVGLTLALVGICTAAVSGGLVGPIVARIGERRAALTGLAFGAAAFAMYGLAPTGSLFLAGVPVMALWGLYGPSSQGIMSKRVSSKEQGQLQGAVMGLRGLSGLISPFIFTFTFATFIGARADLHLPGAPFLLASMLLVIAFFLALRVTSRTAQPV